MILKTFKKIFGSRNDRELKRMSKTVTKVSALEEEYRALSDAELLAKTAEFKLAVSNGKSIDKLIPEAFATVREAGARSLGMRHFDVQLLGVLHFMRDGLLKCEPARVKPWWLLCLLT